MYVALQFGVTDFFCDEKRTKTSRKPDSSLKCQNIILSNIFVNSLAETVIPNRNKGNGNVILIKTPGLYQRNYATSIDHFHKWRRILLFTSNVN